MKLLCQLMSVILFLFFAAACAGNNDTAKPNPSEGPALFMFYTEN